MRRPLIVCLAALCFAGAACAAPIPFGDRDLQITAREQPVASFLQDFFGLIDVPVSVSPTVKGAVNGNFKGKPERLYRDIARAFNLVEYYDGAVLNVYSPQDLSTRTLPVPASVGVRVIRSADELGMTDLHNSVRSSRDGNTLIVSGTRRFIEQFEELARGQTVSERVAATSGFRVFYLRYAWAQDVNIDFGGRQVVLPGVASIVRAMMTSNARSQIAVASYDKPAPSTVQRARNQPYGRFGGLDNINNNGRFGTLGNGDAQAPSGPTLAGAYAAGALPGIGAAASSASNPAGAPAAAPSLLMMGDTLPVRVEADARLNAVIVRDAPDKLAQYEQLITALDVEPQSLEIEATIIDINTDRLRDLGINWRLTKGRSSLLFGNGTDSDLRLTPDTPVGDITPSGNGGFVSAVLGNARQFIARINALEEKGAAKVVSSPQVLTLSNVEAVFDNTQTFYVRVAGRDDVDLFNVSAGTTLRVTPHVFKESDQVRIKMLVTVEDGSLSSRVVDTLPVVERSSINTQALIFEGESLLVGGITRESSTNNNTQVPLLGDIPVVGGLFRSTHLDTSRVERMFLISPRLTSRRTARAVPPANPNPGSLSPPPEPLPLPPATPAPGASSPTAPLS